MDSARGRVPPGLIAAAGVLAVLLMLWSIQQSRQPVPGLDEREGVREELNQVPGIEMMLPTVLPAGYDYGRMYDFNTADDPNVDDTSFDSSDDINSGTEADGADGAGGHADSREVVFFPVKTTDPIPIVIVCEQLASNKNALCPTTSDRRHLQQRVGPYRLAIYAASKDHFDLDSWQTVRFTADLDKVTWLH